MKLNVTVPHQRGGDGKGEKETTSLTSAATVKIVVGYALSLKKMKSFLQPKFIGVARSKGIEFVPIDLNKPLSEQGPFHIILHKLEGKEWYRAIEGVTPGVIVVDPPHAIQHLRNRQLMLEVVSDLKLPYCNGQVCIPRQVVISSESTTIQDKVTKAGLQVPLVVKPLMVDESAKSHELFLAYDLRSLSALDAPVVLQQFINHDAVLFKVFIVGENIQVVRRSSLSNITESDLSKNHGIIPFQRVSSAAASAGTNGQGSCATEFPPCIMVEMLVRELRQRLGLRLFNVDMIRKKESDDYFVIDINYFPGYGKMPNYEAVFSDFLLHLMQEGTQAGTTQKQTPNQPKLD